MIKVKINHIYMNYHTIKGETEALEDISFNVNDGDYLSIVGPSGCGKSTLLNIIAGLLKPSKGEIFIDDFMVNDVNPKIGYMFQKDHLFEWLSVWNNVTIGLKIQKKLTLKNKEKAENLLKNYDLWSFRNHYPKQLSGGMRQRVALIRTLTLDPEVLLLDEPFSALDYQTRLNISDEVFKIIKKESKTAIMVTHDIAEAVSMSNRIIVLSKRPAKIDLSIDTDFSEIYPTPLKRREAPNFRIYFNSIWKELNADENTER